MATAEPSVETKPRAAKAPKAPDFLKGPDKQLLINGKWQPAKSGKTFETVNPATEQVLSRVAEAEQADVDEAVKAARKAFEEGPWPRMRPAERAKYLLKLADLIEAHSAELAQLETLDGGRVIALTQGDAAGAAAALPAARGRTPQIYVEPHPTPPELFHHAPR